MDKKCFKGLWQSRKSRILAGSIYLRKEQFWELTNSRRGGGGVSKLILRFPIMPLHFWTTFEGLIATPEGHSGQFLMISQSQNTTVPLPPTYLPA